MRITRIVVFFLVLAVPCAAYAQQSKKPSPQAQTIEGSIISTDMTRWVEGVTIESKGKMYWVVYFVRGQKRAPTFIGKENYSTGTRVRATVTNDKNSDFLKATRIVWLNNPRVDTLLTETEGTDFQIFFKGFASAIRKRDIAALRLMMSSKFFFLGSLNPDPQGSAFDFLASGNGFGWKELEKSLTTGTKPYEDASPEILARVTNDNLLLFGRGSDGKWRWLRYSTD